ncbi:hypothetical protein GCK72_008353 [Caenorhabditis remanei]|uniref:Uncharacterized protein n=1 Tax=Caenorhabditis remanei TaxID=31234 RepID=A0A6A5GYE2_CAERE|nr:hypothetical protein GCK72_008353 [Caenorhabditis remanei]KAF1760107.1 hypothetical protein GCK72_008353 [Caenorhabditis remanei]
MTDYVVFEEPNVKSAEFSCQTEEIALENEVTQTDEETMSNYEKNEKNPEIAYWKAVVVNRKNEVDRMKQINEKLESEKIEKTRNLEAKQTEYNRLYDLGNEKLNGSKTEDEEEPEGETSCK